MTFIQDLKYEVLTLYKTQGILRNIFLILLMPCTCLPLVLPKSQMYIAGPLVIAIILTINLSYLFATAIKNDIEDGTITLLLTIRKPLYVVMTKFISIFINGLITLLMLIPMLYLFYDYSGIKLLVISSLFTLFLMKISAVSILIASVQSYFCTNTQFLLSLIGPIILPNLIIFGMILIDYNITLLILVVGINMMLLPLMLIMTTYLLKNLYNF